MVAAPDDDITGRDIGAAPADVLARLRLGANFSLMLVRPARCFFNHHDGICALGQRRAGGDFGARAGDDAAARRLACVNAIHDRQAGGRFRTRAARVRGDERVAVHRRP